MIPVQKDSPVCLVDTVTLDLTKVNGDMQPLNSQKLSNEFACAIAIDELRFYVVPSDVAVVAGGLNPGPVCTPYDFGSIIKARVRTGAISLMRQDQPIHLRMLAERTQTFLNYPNQKFTKFVAPVGNISSIFDETFFSCKLPTPLLLGRNAAIDLAVFSDAIADRPLDVSTYYNTVQVSVAAIGRLVPDARPGQVAYPYFDEFAAKVSLNAAKATSYAHGGNPQFLNPFRNPLLIQRFRTALYSDQAKHTNYSPGLDQLPLFPDTVITAIYDSRGGAIAGYGGGNPLPLGMLVDPRTGDWLVERNLDSNMWLNVDFNCVVPAGVVVPDANTGWYPRLAIVGTHMEDFAP